MLQKVLKQMNNVINIHKLALQMDLDVSKSNNVKTLHYKFHVMVVLTVH